MIAWLCDLCGKKKQELPGQFNHKGHKGLHKGHKEKLELPVVLL
jgi:hypothetical protein